MLQGTGTVPWYRTRASTHGFLIDIYQVHNHNIVETSHVRALAWFITAQAARIIILDGFIAGLHRNQSPTNHTHLYRLKADGDYTVYSR
jgi:hypothetical protein